MKKFLCGLFVLFVTVLTIHAEQISDVYFNPSRVGYYDLLKVTEQLVVKGGLQTATVKVSSAPDREVLIMARGTIPDADGNPTSYSYRFGLETDELVAHSGIFADHATINMPGTGFQFTNVNVNGGTAEFTGTGSEENIKSSIGEVASDTKMSFQGETLNAKIVQIKINKQMALEGETAQTQGLRLGGNQIPVAPTSKCNSQMYWALRDLHRVLACSK